MSAEPTPDLQLEIAHLLLIDVVGYSRLLVNEQIELLQELNQIVRNTDCFRAAEASGKFIRVSTGDEDGGRKPWRFVRLALEVGPSTCLRLSCSRRQSPSLLVHRSFSIEQRHRRSRQLLPTRQLAT